jgi:hypothetical protein
VNELPEDFRDLLLELADVGAEFVLVGGHAVAFHGHPRATKDMDVLIRANTNNAERVYRALADFGAPLSNFQVKAEDFSAALIKNKLAAGRAQDLADIQAIERKQD